MLRLENKDRKNSHLDVSKNFKTTATWYISKCLG